MHYEAALPSGLKMREKIRADCGVQLAFTSLFKPLQALQVIGTFVSRQPRARAAAKRSSVAMTQANVSRRSSQGVRSSAISRSGFG